MNSQAADASEDRWQTIINLWKRYQWLYIIAGFLLGLLFFPFVQLAVSDARVLLSDLVPEAISTLVAVLVIDRIYRRHADRERLQELITQMRSKDNGLAVAAAELLGQKEWLRDGSLQHTLLNGANLVDAPLAGAELTKASLCGAILSGAVLTKAKLVNADLKGSNLERATLVLADLSYANLFEANLANAQVDFLTLSSAVLGRANLREVKGWGVDISRASLSDTNLSSAQLCNSNFEEADFRLATLIEADLSGANLQRANFLTADLRHANLTGADLRGTILAYANLIGAKFDSAPQLEGAILPDETRWQPGMELTRFTDPNHPDFWHYSDIDWDGMAKLKHAKWHKTPFHLDSHE